MGSAPRNDEALRWLWVFRLRDSRELLSPAPIRSMRGKQVENVTTQRMGCRVFTIPILFHGIATIWRAESPRKRKPNS